MQLLVSVVSASEARAALAGGADLIDAKDPANGALGPVSLDRFCEICVAVAGARLVSAALGDAADEAAVGRSARAFVAAGAALVKVGFAGISSAERVERLIAAAVRGAESTSLSAGVVAVAYADADRARCISPQEVVDRAASAGARGVLLDTFDKARGGLRALTAPRDLAAWVARAHDARLFVALAGKVAAGDLPSMRDAGADVVGVRGAACEGGRMGRVTADRVHALRSACGVHVARAAAAPYRIADSSAVR